MPVYNIYDYLERVLDCLLNQTYRNLEIILVDDGSTDGSEELCNQYKQKDSRIKVIHQKNSGVSVARNVGVSQATGEYLGFVDSDDVISLEMFEILYQNIITTGADVSVCNYQSFTEQLPKFNKDKNEITIYTKLEVLEDIISDGKITNFLWNKLFKKTLFNGISFPEGKIYEDMYVLPKIFEKTEKVCYTNCCLYGYYQRLNSYVNTYTSNKNNNYLVFTKEIYQHLSKYQELHDALEIYRCFSIYSAFLQASKSHCLDIIKSTEMKKEITIFRKNFKISREVSFKRRLLYYLLYCNKILFYYVVIMIK